MQWHKATRIKVVFRGHRGGDQTEHGSSVIRERDAARGTRSQIGTGGGAVALLVELMSCHITLTGSAPLCSYRKSGGVGALVLGMVGLDNSTPNHRTSGK